MSLESFKSTMPKPDQWPMDDVWAYHDWHQSGKRPGSPVYGGDGAEVEAPTSLPDFERRGADVELCRPPRYLRGDERQPVGTQQRQVAVGDIACLAQHHVADAEFGLRQSLSFYAVKKACEPCTFN